MFDLLNVALVLHSSLGQKNQKLTQESDRMMQRQRHEQGDMNMGVGLRERGFALPVESQLHPSEQDLIQSHLEDPGPTLFCFGFGSHSVVLSVYSQFCSQGSLLADIGVHYLVLDVKPRSATSEESILCLGLTLGFDTAFSRVLPSALG